MRPEVGAAAAGGCSPLLSSPLSFSSITLSPSLILPLTLPLPVFQSLFPSPSRPSVDLLSVACCCCCCCWQTFAVLQQKLCYSGDSGDRHFISALLTSWWWTCVNICVCARVRAWAMMVAGWCVGGGGVMGWRVEKGRGGRLHRCPPPPPHSQTEIMGGSW